MSAIWIQTLPLGNNKYQFIHSLQTGLSWAAESINDYPNEVEDRLRASIINFGLACHYFIEGQGAYEGTPRIVIASDKDGKDIKHGGEHEILYSLLYPHSDYEMRKLYGLYREYEKYTLRAKELIKSAGIKVKILLDGTELQEVYR